MHCCSPTSTSTQTMTTHHSSSKSPFLQCVACLDVDTWARVLLPKLTKQGSAPNVALACSQLRDLCYGAVQHINLSTLHAGGDISAVEDSVQGVPQHFTNCTSVQVLVRVDSYHTTPYLLPALARWATPLLPLHLWEVR